MTLRVTYRRNRYRTLDLPTEIPGIDLATDQNSGSAVDIIGDLVKPQVHQATMTVGTSTNDTSKSEVITFVDEVVVLDNYNYNIVQPPPLVEDVDSSEDKDKNNDGYKDKGNAGPQECDPRIFPDDHNLNLGCI